MAKTIRLKRGLSANLNKLTLAPGEPAVCIDNGDFYVGGETEKFHVNPVKSVNGNTGHVSITSIEGNSGTASKLQTARNISLSGDVTGTALFDGSENIIINAVISDIDGGTF